MLSLYLHIPFCRHKCSYCSFFVLPEEHANKDLEELKEQYLQQLLHEVDMKRAWFPEHPLKTLYLGGGTPLQLGNERLRRLLDHILAARGYEDMEEMTIELNPDPQDEVLAFVAETQARYPQLMRIRRSFGIQTFDDELLKQTKRAYTFGEIVYFLRELPAIKQQNTVYNIDLIAFGKAEKEKGKGPWSKTARDFFERVLQSYAFDGFSVYTLELFPGSDRYYQDRHMSAAQRVRGNDEDITQEANRIKQKLANAGYNRYEVSNFSLSGKRSLHNMVYRTGGSYLGLGMYSSSYLNQQDLNYISQKSLTTDPEYIRLLAGEAMSAQNSDIAGIRRKHTQHRKEYLAGGSLDATSIQYMSAKENRIEQVILGLRTDRGLADYESYTDLFVEVWPELLDRYEEYGLIQRKEGNLLLTEAGRDVYNTLITDLLREV